MNDHPCLNQLLLVWRHVTRNALAGFDQVNSLLALSFRVYVRRMMLFVVEEVHANENAEKHADGRHGDAPLTVTAAARIALCCLRVEIGVPTRINSSPTPIILARRHGVWSATSLFHPHSQPRIRSQFGRCRGQSFFQVIERENFFLAPHCFAHALLQHLYRGASQIILVGRSICESKAKGKGILRSCIV